MLVVSARSYSSGLKHVWVFWSGDILYEPFCRFTMGWTKICLLFCWVKTYSAQP